MHDYDDVEKIIQDKVQSLPDEYRDAGEAWLRDLQGMGRAAETIRTYGVYLAAAVAEFSEVLQKPITLDEFVMLDRPTGLAWQTMLIARGFKASSVNVKISAVWSFIAFMAKHRLQGVGSIVSIAKLPVSKLRSRVNAPETTQQAASAVHERQLGLEFEGEPWIKARNEAIMSVVAATGALNSEIVALKRPEGEPEAWEAVELVGGTKLKARSAALDAASVLAIGSYLDLAPFDVEPGTALFRAEDHGPMGKWSISTMFDRTAKQSGLPGQITAQATRAGLARRLHAEGVGPEEIGCRLGMRSISNVEALLDIRDPAEDQGRQRAGVAWLRQGLDDDGGDLQARRFVAHLMTDTSVAFVTAILYGRIVMRFMEFIRGQGVSIADIDDGVLKAYLEGPSSRDREARRKQHQSALAGFCGWLQGRGVITAYPSLLLTYGSKKAVVFDYQPMEVLDAFIGVLDAGSTASDARVALIASLGCHHGLGLTEILDLRWSDIKEPMADRPGGIKLGDDTVAMHASLAHRLRRWREVAPQVGADGRVFPRENRSFRASVSPVKLQRDLRDASLRLGFPLLTFRALRHSFIAESLKICDITTVARMARIKGSDLVQIYRDTMIARGDLAPPGANDNRLLPMTVAPAA